MKEDGEWGHAKSNLPELNYFHDFTFHKDMYKAQNHAVSSYDSEDQEEISTKNTSIYHNL